MRTSQAASGKTVPGGRWPAVGAALVALGVLAGCNDGSELDWDLRRNGFSTAEAARGASGGRPQPDARGVISYPGYQVAVAQPGDTVAAIAMRLGQDPAELGRRNALAPDSGLRGGELLVLPRRVPDGSGSNGAIAVTPLSPAGAGGVMTAPGMSVGAEPIRHTVQRGETAFTIARLYDLPARTLAEWNGLPADLSVREGQVLIIPAPQSITEAAAAPAANIPLPAVQLPAGSTAQTMAQQPLPGPGGTQTAAPATTTPAPATTAPGTGSPTPVPPSASTPLPQSTPQPAGQGTTSAAPTGQPPVANLGAERSQGPRLVMPAQGRVIRAYQRGRNDGIGIGAPAGSEVRAAAAGTVAAITRDTDQVPILVIRHENNLLTVYANIDDIRVERGARVSSGQAIATVRRGDPPFLHFEVREGLESVDPMPYLQ